MKLDDKILKIKEHFFSTNLSKTDFYNSFFEMYGYQKADSLRKLMTKKIYQQEKGQVKKLINSYHH